MIEDKEYEHHVHHNKVRTTLRVSAEHITGSSIEQEMSARALNKSTIRDLLYGKELREIESLLSILYYHMDPWNIEGTKALTEARQLCVELLK